MPAPKLPAPTMTTVLKSGVSLSGADIEDDEERGVAGIEGDGGVEEGDEEEADESSGYVLVFSCIVAVIRFL